MNAKAKTDSLSVSRKRKKIVLTVTAVCAVGLVIYGILLPSEDKEVDQIKDALLALTAPEDEKMLQKDPATMVDLMQGKTPKTIPKEKLEKISNMMKELSPKTRKIIKREVIKERLKWLRKKTSQMTQQEKDELVNKMVNEVRERFKNMSKASRDAMKNNMASEKGKEDAKEALDSYYNDCSAQERQTYDPIVNEYLNNINAL